MTNEEKEILYQEFVRRFKKEPKEQSSGYKTMNNMKPAHDYYWDRYNNLHEQHKFEGDWMTKIIPGMDWDFVRKLVCHAYGISLVKDIPDEKLDAANALGQKIAELLFDANEQTMKES
jgi:hypothetical protein